VLIARGIVVAVLALAIPVLAAAPARGVAPSHGVSRVTCTGPVPPGGEINRCNALRAMAELRGG
jgi:hypothetical protein